jgi:hypothetical protein
MSTPQAIRGLQSGAPHHSAAAVRRHARRAGLLRARWSLALCGLLLAGCDKVALPGMGGPSSAEVRREAEGRAIGGACRHAARAIEDCFALNRQADKAAIFAGWREMNDYMAEKNLAPVPAASAGSAPDGAGTRPDAATPGVR